MEIVYSEIDLSSIEFGSILRKSFGFSQMGEHLASTDEVHDKEYFLFGLECKL